MYMAGVEVTLILQSEGHHMVTWRDMPCSHGKRKSSSHFEHYA